MRRRSEDQAIVLSGMTGSGKSTTHYHLLKEILYLSTHNRHDEKMQQQILGAHAILRSFSVAASIHNETSSCLSQMQTLQFNKKGRIVGSALSVFLLNTQRVSQTSLQQYDIFYQLVAGTTPDEKQALQMTHSNFNYLKQQRDTQQDSLNFEELKIMLQSCGFKPITIAQMCQLLAAILHLGNVQFADNTRHGNNTNESCRIRNKELLNLVAGALGVATSRLETTLTHKLKLIDNEFCTAFLTKETAIKQRDALAHTLYAALVLWITNAFNQKLSAENVSEDADPQKKITKAISILDIEGFNLSITMQNTGRFHDICVNYVNEQLQSYIFDRRVNANANANVECSKDGAWRYTLSSEMKIPNQTLRFFHGTEESQPTFINLLNEASDQFEKHEANSTDSSLLSKLLQRKMESQAKEDYAVFTDSSSNAFGFKIQHFSNTTSIDYSIDGFIESNVSAISPEFVDLFRHNCTNEFVQELFEADSLAGWVTDTHFRDKETVIKAQLPIWSSYRDKAKKEEPNSEKSELNKQGRLKRGKKLTKPASNTLTAMNQIVKGVELLKQKLDSSMVIEIIHICPNNMQKPDFFDLDFVRQQIKILRITEMASQTVYVDTMLYHTPKNFVQFYRPLMDEALPQFDFDELFEDEEEDEYEQASALKECISQWADAMQWSDRQILFGHRNIWMAFSLWRMLENQIRSLEKNKRQKVKLDTVPSTTDLEQDLLTEGHETPRQIAAHSRTTTSDYDFSDITSYTDYQQNVSEEKRDETDSKKLDESFGPNMDMSKMMKNYSVEAEEHIEEVTVTRLRRWWSRFVWLMTWWVPTFLLSYMGNMKRQDVQMAWREKLTLCLLIFGFSATIIFFIVGLSPVVCPGTKTLYSSEDVFSHQAMDNYWVSVRGKVYDVTSFVATEHGTPVHLATKSNMYSLAGLDLSYTFPPPLSIACTGLVQDPLLTISPNETIQLGPFIHVSGPQQQEAGLDKLADPYWLNKYFGSTMSLYRKGDVVITMKQIKEDYIGWGRLIASIDDRVYDITDYMNTARRFPLDVPGVPDYHFLDPSVEALFTKFGGKDVTAEWNKYSQAMNEETRRRNKACLDNVFYIGRVDYRETLRCTFINYLLLSFAIIMSVVILVKFLAALQFGGSPTPDDHDRFVICQVPCYTEDEDSLRKTIDSLARMTYNDKYKLLFLIADGMIIGSGNSKPTPRILLDILKHDDSDDPEALMFKSIGEGSKRLNYGKVYSGLYEYEGHTVPYIVVVKVGKSNEKIKPGNRGKRDSQIICMSFLNKVHFDSEMTPLELEIYYQMKHVIGVDPALYEYILMVDSDTEVYSDSLNRLISCMLHDSRIIGLCGETELGNEDRSWITMIQVYEYYISHHLVKSFESLFGSVTCLPGCFCMYRIRTATSQQPLIVSNVVIQGYSDNQVDTLHKKNLLHLGEDRYLTTLMMKNFPQYKMMFTPYAKCKTVAPDKWRVLLSQRRRWINSTIHNLLELILLHELCGFCCLSMRFVVLTDLIGTITLPSSVIYLVYLMYEVITGSGPIPTIALGMLAGAYGLQSLIFIIKRQWQHVGWMIIYIFAIPIFSFFIPLYAFWHFDDFSWGNTRVVVGDNRKQIIVSDEEKFDESIIPLKKWSVYEQELLETKTATSYSTNPAIPEYAYDDIQSVSDSHSYSHSYYRPPQYNSSYESRTLISHPTMNTENTQHTQHTQHSRFQSGPTSNTALADTESVVYSVELSSAMRSRVSSRSDFRRDGDMVESRSVALPEDEELEKEIREILLNANLMTLTKKQVRNELSARFGVDFNAKKNLINTTIERILEQEYQ
ncbi:chitin synthase-domain-containing protein [Blakeslea trispora]|nr:chitin synthase-domain-containing protein [Blakeslea trispora]